MSFYWSSPAARRLTSPAPVEPSPHVFSTSVGTGRTISPQTTCEDAATHILPPNSQLKSPLFPTILLVEAGQQQTSAADAGSQMIIDDIDYIDPFVWKTDLLIDKCLQQTKPVFTASPPLKLPSIQGSHSF